MRSVCSVCDFAGLVCTKLLLPVWHVASILSFNKNMACSFGMDDALLETIGRHCTKLVNVKLLDSLHRRSDISEKGLHHLAGYPHLKTLSICVNWMTCESLGFFSQRKSDIQCLKLYLESEELSLYVQGANNAVILDEGFARLVELCEKLEKLRASSVSDKFFSSIAGKNLQVLIVSVAESSCGKTPDLRDLARSCPRLQKIGIEGCWFPALPNHVFLKKVKYY